MGVTTHTLRKEMECESGKQLLIYDNWDSAAHKETVAFHVIGPKGRTQAVFELDTDDADQLGAFLVEYYHDTAGFEVE